MSLELPGLGELDLDPKLDLGQHRVETGITGGGFQVGGGVAQPQHGGLIEIAGEQLELELVEHVERALAACEGTPAPLGRVLLDALQRDQCVDIGGGLRRHGGAGVGGRADIFRQREAGRRGPLGARSRRPQRRAVRSVDAHGLIPRGAGTTFALLWLTRRKRPGKICREAATSIPLVTARLIAMRKFYSTKSANYTASTIWHGARIERAGRNAMGV